MERNYSVFLEKPLDMAENENRFLLDSPRVSTGIRIGGSKMGRRFQDWLLKPLGQPSVCPKLYHLPNQKSSVLQECAISCLTFGWGCARILWQSHIACFIRSDTQEAEGAPLLRE